LTNGGGAAFAPAHAGGFEAVADHGFAGGFDHAGADQPAVGQVGRIVGAMQVVAQVAGQFAVGFANFGRAIGKVEGFQIV
jgi:hypothetical protein